MKLCRSGFCQMWTWAWDNLDTICECKCQQVELSRHGRINWNVVWRGKCWLKGCLGQASVTALGWKRSHSCCCILCFLKRLKYRVSPETLSWLSVGRATMPAPPPPAFWLGKEASFFIHRKSDVLQDQQCIRRALFEQSFYFWCVGLYWLLSYSLGLFSNWSEQTDNFLGIHWYFCCAILES